ncbi:hypothetical protein DYY65_06860 [Nitrososphaera sp. AFS]|nr:hypothetical protein [Nitrososphaera sp. AFS]
MFLITFSELLGHNLRSLSLGKLAISDAQLGNKFSNRSEKNLLEVHSCRNTLFDNTGITYQT